MNREAVEESGKLGEILFWMRSGAAGKTSNYHIADRRVETSGGLSKYFPDGDANPKDRDAKLIFSTFLTETG